MKRLILLYIFVILNLLCYTNTLPLKHEEPRRAIIAQEMLLTNDFIVPKICQIPYYKKPPFHNWIIALTSLKDKYISNLDARIPSLVALILLSFLIYILLQKNSSISAIIALTSFSTMVSYGMKAEPDMLFTFLFFASYFFFIKEKILLSSLFMGASILTKGISPLFFYPPLIIYSFFYNEKKKILRNLALHFLLSLILPIIWIILYSLKGNLENLINSLFFEVKDRTVSNIMDILKDASLFPFRAFFALFPWSIFLIFFSKKKFIRLTNDKIIFSSTLIFLWIFSILFIFPCGKGRYFLPAVPFFAIIAGNFINFETILNKKILSFISLTCICLCISGMIFFLIKGYFFQSLIILIIGIFSFIHFKISLNAKEVAVGISLFILLISSHFFNFYRSKYMYNYHKTALEIVNKIKKYNLPIVVDNNYRKLRLLFNLEREYRKPLYRENHFKKYIFLSTHKINKNKFLFSKKVKNKILYFYIIERS